MSDTWHWPVGTDPKPGRPEDDFEVIKSFLFQVIIEDWLWKSHFDELGIEPIVLKYEEYETDRASHLARINAFLGEKGRPTKLENQLQVMRDE